MKDLLAGIYEHYKGHLYLVVGYGHDARYTDREVVVYLGLELDDAKTGARWAVRDVEEFFEEVCGDIECSNFGQPQPWEAKCGEHTVERFKYIGPTYLGEIHRG